MDKFKQIKLEGLTYNEAINFSLKNIYQKYLPYDGRIFNIRVGASNGIVVDTKHSKSKKIIANFGTEFISKGFGSDRRYNATPYLTSIFLEEKLKFDQLPTLLEIEMILAKACLKFVKSLFLEESED